MAAQEHSMTKPPRIWISSTSPKKGDVLRVRAQIEHTMESGLRRDADGRPTKDRREG